VSYIQFSWEILNGYFMWKPNFFEYLFECMNYLLVNLYIGTGLK